MPKFENNVFKAEGQKMGTIRTSCLALLICGTFPALGNAESFKADLIEPGWGKSIPSSQVCKRFGGKNAASPKIKVSGIPRGTASIHVWFNDDTYNPMGWGGHGKIKVAVPKEAKELIIPRVSAETNELPPGVSSVSEHQGSGWSGTGGVYLPPCSGGRGNSYSVWLYAKDKDGKKLGDKLIVEIGDF